MSFAVDQSSILVKSRLSFSPQQAFEGSTKFGKESKLFNLFQSSLSAAKTQSLLGISLAVSYQSCRGPVLLYISDQLEHCWTVLINSLEGQFSDTTKLERNDFNGIGSNRFTRGDQ